MVYSISKTTSPVEREKTSVTSSKVLQRCELTMCPPTLGLKPRLFVRADVYMYDTHHTKNGRKTFIIHLVQDDVNWALRER